MSLKRVNEKKNPCRVVNTIRCKCSLQWLMILLPALSTKWLSTYFSWLMMHLQPPTVPTLCLPASITLTDFTGSALSLHTVVLGLHDFKDSHVNCFHYFSKISQQNIYLSFVLKNSTVWRTLSSPEWMIIVSGTYCHHRPFSCFLTQLRRASHHTPRCGRW